MNSVEAGPQLNRADTQVATTPAALAWSKEPEDRVGPGEYEFPALVDLTPSWKRPLLSFRERIGSRLAEHARKFALLFMVGRAVLPTISSLAQTTQTLIGPEEQIQIQTGLAYANPFEEVGVESVVEQELPELPEESFPQGPEVLQQVSQSLTRKGLPRVGSVDF